MDQASGSWTSPLKFVLVATLLVLSTLAGAAHASSSPPYQAQGFEVLNLAWGTGTGLGEAGPGSAGVPLVVTFQYILPFYVAVSSEATLNLTGTGFTATDGSLNETVYRYGALSPGNTFQMTFYLDLNQTISLGRHSVPATFLWTAILTNSTNEPQAYLTQTVALNVDVTGDVHLGISSPQSFLLPGSLDNVSITLTNTGTLNATDIQTTVAASQGVGVISSVPDVASLAPGASITAPVEVYVDSAAAGTSVTLSVSATYSDPNGVGGSASRDFSYVVYSAAAGTQLAVAAPGAAVTEGAVSELSFVVTNTGTSTVRSPTFSVVVPSPLVLAGNSTYSAYGASIAPGESFVFHADLTATPGATAGIYQGTLQVGYDDAHGFSHTVTSAFAVSLTGTVDFVIQDEKTTQSLSGVTVTGSLLNEGSASAYYALVTAQVSSTGAASPDYVGEVDPNSPTPFSVTVPYRAPAAGGVENLTLTVQYRNSLGETSNFTSSGALRLESASQLMLQQSPATTTTTGQGGEGLSFYVEVAALAILAVGVVAWAARRRRRRGSRPLRAGGADRIS